MQVQALAVSRVELAYIALGTIFVFFGIASCIVAALRRRSQAMVLIWLGLWSAIYGTTLLFRIPAFVLALPHAVQTCVPLTNATISFLNLVTGMLVWSELTLGKMRRISQAMAITGIVIAIAGVVEILATGSDFRLVLCNRILAVCALLLLGALVTVPALSNRYLAFPNRILAVSTIVFFIDALYRNVWLGLSMPSLGLPYIVDDVVFAIFLLSFAYVAGVKVFASEHRLLSIENELEIARQIQASILPDGTPQTDSLTIAASYLPMTAIGGDFYQFVQVDRQHLGFLLADVSGHGVPAALISTMLKVAMHTVSSCSSQPGEVLCGLNRVLSGELRGQLISAAYLWIDTVQRKAWYSSAGHPPLLRWRAGNSNQIGSSGRAATLDSIESNGILIGVLPDAKYPVRELTLNPGDRFLLYTDGVVEPENAAGDAFGAGELERMIRKHALESPAELSAKLLEEIRLWQPHTVAQQDDITLLVIDVT